MYTKTGLIFLLALILINAQGDNCCKDNQIQVSGEGKASALPDMAVVRIRFN